MISINQSNFRNLKTYYQFTRQQLENLQNQVKLVMKDQSAQINIMALFDVLTNCEQTAYISIELLKLCLHLAEDKNYLSTLIQSLRQQNLSLVIKNKELSQTLQQIQEYKRYNGIIFNQIQQEIKEKMEKKQLSQSDSTSVKEMIGKLALSKLQLKFYENELQMRQNKIKKLQLEISNIKNQIALKDLQLQQTNLVQKRSSGKINDLDLSQNKIRDTHSSSLNHFRQEMLQSKQSINEPPEIKSGSLMQDLVESQIILNELPFCSPFKQEYLQKVPQIQQSNSQFKNEFFELEYFSRISKPNAHKKDKKLSIIFIQRVKDSKISLGVQIQDSSKMKRLHEWLRTKVISQRIKM